MRRTKQDGLADRAQLLVWLCLAQLHRHLTLADGREASFSQAVRHVLDLAK